MTTIEAITAIQNCPTLRCRERRLKADEAFQILASGISFEVCFLCAKKYPAPDQLEGKSAPDSIGVNRHKADSLWPPQPEKLRRVSNQPRMYIKLANLAMPAMLLIIATVAFGQSDLRTDATNRKAQQVITVREGQFVQMTVADINKNGVVTVSNPTDLVGDIDLSIADKDGFEVARDSVEAEPNTKTEVVIQKVFPDFDFTTPVTVYVGVSLRARPTFMGEARTLPINFFSQRDPRWKNEKMGRSGLTIGGYGCAMTSVTMAGCSKMTGLTPSTMNTWLSNNSGYTAGGAIYWGKPPGFQPTSGFSYLGEATVKNAATLKALIDAGKFVVAYSKRFENVNSTHWTVIYKYNGDGSRLNQFEYLDPYDLQYALHTVDDGKVTSASRTQIYK
jgi:hypothetical protein